MDDAPARASLAGRSATAATPDAVAPDVVAPDAVAPVAATPDAVAADAVAPGAGTRTSGSAGGAPRAGRPRDEEREQAILDAALELVADVGYDRMSIEGVATRAGSSKATIYRRWSGKADLVADAVRRRVAPQLAEPPDTGSLRGDLRDLAGRMIANMAGVDGGLMCGMASTVRADAEFGRLLSSHMHEDKLRAVGLIVARARARGELGPDADPHLVLEVAPGVALFHQMSGEPLDGAFADHLVDRVLIPILRHSPRPSPSNPLR